MLEVWTSDQPVTTLQKNGCSFAMSGDVLAGAISLDEKAGATLDVTTELAYRQLLHHTRELGFPYLWRVWNFFPDINEEETGLERYRRFCVGRYQALEASLQNFPSALPAGTAVGTRSGPLQIYFLAGAHPATHLGNPRQMNAYEYPKDYGPQSPSFARATFCSSESGPQLFIAGTASAWDTEPTCRSPQRANTRNGSQSSDLYRICRQYGAEGNKIIPPRDLQGLRAKSGSTDLRPAGSSRSSTELQPDIVTPGRPVPSGTASRDRRARHVGLISPMQLHLASPEQTGLASVHTQEGPVMIRGTATGNSLSMATGMARPLPRSFTLRSTAIGCPALTSDSKCCWPSV